MILRRLYETFKSACAFWVEDGASQMGAALAYYALFSLAPLLFIAIAVAGVVYGEAAARGHVVERIRDLIGSEGASTVQTMLENFRYPAAQPWAAAVGVATMWYGAMGVFTQLRSSLTRIWRLKPKSESVVGGFVKDYLLAFLMVLVTSIFILLLLTASTVMAVVWEWWRVQVPAATWAWPLADFLTCASLFLLLFAFTYRFMSDGRIPYRYVWGGAAVSAVLFSLGKMAISFYLSHSLLASAYGAAGSLVVFLVWVYYSGQIFFFGAEIIRARLER